MRAASLAAIASRPWAGTPRLARRDYRLFQALIEREAGIHLGPTKQALLVARLSGRMRELGIPSFNAYYRRVTADAAERTQMLDRICTNETHFFRELRHFEFLEHQVIPAWLTAAAAGARPRRVRVWSAACSTGEEPYSLAMLLSDRLPAAAGWRIEIEASDLSTRALRCAEAAVWPLERAQEIPRRYLRAFMLQGTGCQRDRMKAGPELRGMIRFRHVNLNASAYPVAGTFDLVFCRNVLIYFDTDAKRRVIHRLLAHVAPDGYLLLGHAESLHGVTDRVRSVLPTVYAFAGRPAADGR